MTPPSFWNHGHTPPWLLRPVAWLFAEITARRVAKPGWSAPIPVICCGNAGAGGAGKTPLALDLATRLITRGHHPAFLTRGHGGTAKIPLRADPALHTATEVGDEALLLAALAPTFVGANRAASAALAIGQGADILVMDDGLQNPGLTKTLSLLVIDGGAGFGNGHVIPAGPNREPPTIAAARCRAAILIGPDATHAASALPPTTAILTADIVPSTPDLEALPPRLLAFAGIGRPTKFFETLRTHGHPPLAEIAFPDHHRYSQTDLATLRTRAAALNASLVTTAKDLVRLPPADRADIHVLRITLAWANPAGIDALLDEALTRP